MRRLRRKHGRKARVRVKSSQSSVLGSGLASSRPLHLFVSNGECTMKVFLMTIAFAGAATAAPLVAQGNGRNVDGVPTGQRPPAGMCRVWVDGVPPGRQSAATDCATARARAATNGGRVIYGSNRGRGSNRDDCTYTQSTSSVGDIIFGRSGTNTTNCRDNRSTRVNGAWYPVGRDGNGNTIYERRTTDANGNVIIQRARRDTFGNMTIISTRNGGNNGRLNNNRRRGGDDDENGTWNNNRRHGDDDEQGDNDGDEGRGKWSNRGNSDDSYNNSDYRY